MDIIYQDPGGIGYHPVMHMVLLAKELFEADLLIFPKQQQPTIPQKLSKVFPSRLGKDCCLVICTCPSSLQVLQLVPNWRRRYRQVVAWVFDSFWVNHIPWIARNLPRHFDHIFVTEPEDIAQWHHITGIPTSWLPWGSDALRLGSFNEKRSIDLLRIGRQPEQWNDDKKMTEICREKNISFHGRPACYRDATENEMELMSVLSRSRFSLSWSNRVSPAIQTHPEREYITGRWTDALAAGTVVAGIAPRTEVVQELFWPGALLELCNIDPDPGLEEIQQALQCWTPKQAHRNARLALERLDWRWRFKELADIFGRVPSSLEKELNTLQSLLASTS